MTKLDPPKVSAHIERTHGPFADLEQYVIASMFMISPERSMPLREELRGVQFRLLDRNFWVAHYIAAPPQIEISWRMVEALWCCAYATVTLVDGVIPAAYGQPFDLTRDPEIASAMKLLQWALDDCYSRRGSAFPAALLPQRNPRIFASRAHSADELCLCAIAFILHHEVAHHRLRHTHDSSAPLSGPDPDSISAEREADGEAIDWILASVKDDSIFFTKRAGGIAVALVMLAARGVHLGEFGGTTHPRSFDRLANWLDNYTNDPNNTVWVIIATTLKLHLDNSALLKPPGGEFASFRECADCCFECLATKWRELEGANH